MKAQHDLAGYGMFGIALAFDRWASQLHAPPTPEQVQERFRVSRAVSYRWLNAWADAAGVEVVGRRKRAA